MSAASTSFVETAAHRAKKKLRAEIINNPWFRGIGVVHDTTHGFAVKVYVSQISKEIWTEIPAQVDGVKVFVGTMDEMRAR